MDPSLQPRSPQPGDGRPNPPEAPLRDLPDDGFGFVDDLPDSSSVQPIVPDVPMRNTSPVVAPPRPQPLAQPLPRPVVPVSEPVIAPQPPTPVVAPVPAPTSVTAPVPGAPAPVQPTPLPQAPAPPTPRPADIMPPQNIPSVPTFTPPAAAPQNPVPPIVARPVAPPHQEAAPITPLQTIAPRPVTPPTPPPPASQPATARPFDPSAVPVHASSTSENPLTATFTPATQTHLPDDIAKRIGEHPIQNSDEVLRLAKHGFDLKRVKSIVSFIVFTASIFVAAFLINQFIFQSYYVEGTSMVPTLQNNDRLIISKVERTLAGVQGKPYIPERGQIVVLDSSIVGLNGQKEQLIKRVIGLPGDHIHIENGAVIITNAAHPDGYDVTTNLGLTNLLATYTDAPIDVTIPGGHVYVMGDNRAQGGSYDSRAFGAIEGNKIQGRLWARILPLDKAQVF